MHTENTANFSPDQPTQTINASPGLGVQLPKPESAESKSPELESPATAHQPQYRAQLCNLLEQVIDQLKSGSEQLALTDRQSDLSNLSKEPQSIQLRVAPVSVRDRTEEIFELKSLLIEAQETIIKLLTDRVEDRSRLATLEMELKLLPLRSPASLETIHALNGATTSSRNGSNSDSDNESLNQHENLRDELLRVKMELEHLEKVHSHMRLKQKKTSLWVKVWQSLKA